MNIIKKTVGIIAGLFGLGIWYLDILIMGSIHAVANEINTAIAGSPDVSLLITVIGWILFSSVLIIIFGLGIAMLWIAYLCFED